MLSQVTRSTLLFGCLALSQIPTTRTSAEEPFRVDVFISGTGGYHTYRIPSIIASKKGTLLAVCEGRKTSRRPYRRRLCINSSDAPSMK